LKKALVEFCKNNSGKHGDERIFLPTSSPYIPKYVQECVRKHSEDMRISFDVQTREELTIWMLHFYVGRRGMVAAYDKYDINPTELGEMGMVAVCNKYSITLDELGEMSMVAACKTHDMPPLVNASGCQRVQTNMNMTVSILNGWLASHGECPASKS
jgi:hypothetical protein